MAEVIIADDAEGRAITFLKAQLAARGDTAKVGTKFPASGSSRFVRVMRAGGVSDLAYDRPRLVFICSEASTVKAERLCALVRGLVLAWARLDDAVTRVQDAGDMAYLPDPDTGQDRYQFAVEVTLKMSAI